jgi:hypothetical protein
MRRAATRTFHLALVAFGTQTDGSGVGTIACVAAKK